MFFFEQLADGDQVDLIDNGPFSLAAECSTRDGDAHVSRVGVEWGNEALYHGRGAHLQLATLLLLVFADVPGASSSALNVLVLVLRFIR